MKEPRHWFHEETSICLGGHWFHEGTSMCPRDVLRQGSRGSTYATLLLLSPTGNCSLPHKRMSELCLRSEALASYLYQSGTCEESPSGRADLSLWVGKPTFH
jgi:hypothetical protein